jgi:hypothetical protein
MLNFRATYATFSCNSALARLKPERERVKSVLFCHLRKLTKRGIFPHTKTGPEPPSERNEQLVEPGRGRTKPVRRVEGLGQGEEGGVVADEVWR